ncbi:MAG: ribonuclease P protein component [Dongiaceae bacterium]
MPTVERLKRRPEFLRVAGGRRKWVAPGLILQALDRPAVTGTTGSDAMSARIGFTASSRIGGAVVRNRARRRLRAAAASVMPVHAAPAHDYVLIARSGTLNRKFTDLVGDLETALRRLSLYRNGDHGPVGNVDRAGNEHAA